MKKILVSLVLVVLILLTALYFAFLRNRSEKQIYQTERITRGSVVVQVRSTGTIEPIKTVEVGSQVSGIIKKLFVDFNSSVKKGQIMAQLDTTFFAASVRSSKADVANAEAVLKNARINLDRITVLHQKLLSSDASFDSATTAYSSAAAQLKLAQATLTGDLTNLSYTTIRSPIDGVVISRDIDIGQTVASSYQTPKMFEVANNLKQMQVEASVDEADIGQVKNGQSVTFTVDAYPDEEFTGTVSQIRLDPEVSQNVTTYTVIILVENPDLKLRPGMTATITVLINKHDGVLRIPDLALKFNPPPELISKLADDKLIDTSLIGMRRFPPNQGRIWVLGNNKMPRPVAITTGLDNMRYIEISAGELKEGDTVILGLQGNELATLE
jgi:HlyD family secretion protein